MRNEGTKAGVEESKKEKNRQLVDFLEYAIEYLENRIGLLDNKASILIAAQGAIFAVATYITKEIFLTPSRLVSSVGLEYKLLGYTVLGGIFLISFVTVLLLLQTVRRARLFLGLGTPIDRLGTKHYVMWFHDKFPQKPEDYKKEIAALEQCPAEIQKNYEETHFACLQLIRRKYGFYRWAVVFMKLSVLWSGIGILVLTLALRLPVGQVAVVWVAIWVAIPIALLIMKLKERAKKRD